MFDIWLDNVGAYHILPQGSYRVEIDAAGWAAGACVITQDGHEIAVDGGKFYHEAASMASAIQIVKSQT